MSDNNTPPRLTRLPVWQQLTDHYQQISGLHMRNLFAEHPSRFEDFSIGPTRKQRYPRA